MPPSPVVQKIRTTFTTRSWEYVSNVHLGCWCIDGLFSEVQIQWMSQCKRPLHLWFFLPGCTITVLMLTKVTVMSPIVLLLTSGKMKWTVLFHLSKQKEQRSRPVMVLSPLGSCLMAGIILTTLVWMVATTDSDTTTTSVRLLELHFHAIDCTARLSILLVSHDRHYSHLDNVVILEIQVVAEEHICFTGRRHY